MFITLCLLIQALLATIAFGQDLLVDYGSLNGIGVETLEVCKHSYTPDYTSPSGHTVKMLAAAYVYMGPSNGLSVLGHASERFIYCHDQNLIDNLFGYYKPEAGEIEGTLFEEEYGIRIQDYSDDERAKWRESLYVHSTLDPATAYVKEQLKINRTITEAWLDLDGQTMLKMLFANVDRYQEQKRRIINHLPLPEYAVFANNCTEAVQADLALVNPKFKPRKNPLLSLPKHLLQKIENQIKTVIVYPSQTDLRWIQHEKTERDPRVQAFVPTSRVYRGAFSGSWVLVYDRNSRTLLKPIVGALNLAAGVGETIYGLLSAPFRKKNHFHRFKAGLRDISQSSPELIFIKIRYPRATPWTSDDIEFLKGLQRKSALMELLVQH